MSNRKRPRNRKLVAQRALDEGKLVLPSHEAEIVHEVPAVIHWKDVPSIERNDDEIIGRALIYDDGTNDVVINDDISEDAKKLVYGVFGGVDHFSIAEPRPN